MTGHIDKLWLSYREEVVPPDADFTQVLETKRAFFSGALALLNAFMGPLLEEGPEEPTEQDMMRMAEIDEELRAFGRSGGLL